MADPLFNMGTLPYIVFLTETGEYCFFFFSSNAENSNLV